jgi:DNA polymerase-3 subunit alpha
MFVHLRNHTHYSLLKALPKIPDLVKKAKESGMTSLAITDYNNMYGAIEFYSTCKKEGVRPIIGVEFTISYQERKFQIVLLAKNLSGYKNLMHITSLVNIENPVEPILNDEILVKYKDGILVISGGFWGDVSNLLLVDETLALSRLSFYKKNFSDSYYLEVNPQSNLDTAAEIRRKTIDLAKKTNTPLVATWNTHYLYPKDKSRKLLWIIFCITLCFCKFSQGNRFS